MLATVYRRDCSRGGWVCIGGWDWRQGGHLQVIFRPVTQALKVGALCSETRCLCPQGSAASDLIVGHIWRPCQFSWLLFDDDSYHRQFSLNPFQPWPRRVNLLPPPSRFLIPDFSSLTLKLQNSSASPRFSQFTEELHTHFPVLGISGASLGPSSDGHHIQ